MSIEEREAKKEVSTKNVAKKKCVGEKKRFLVAMYLLRSEKISALIVFSFAF